MSKKNKSDKKARKSDKALSVKNEVQYIKSSDPAIIELLGGMRSSSGYVVTDDSAMRVSAVAGCINLIGGSIASLPLAFYRRTDSGREKVSLPISYLFNERPCGAWTAATMKEWWVRCNALRGDSFSRIERDRFGDVSRIVPLHPDRVTPLPDGEGELLYRYQPKNGAARVYQDNEILHIPGFGYDGETGRSLTVIQHAAFQSIGIALAADEFSGRFFKNGATPKHLITSPGKMGQEQIDELKDQYAQKYAGPENAGKPLVLTQGLDIKELSLSSVDAELLESRKYQVIDIARAFGVPPFMIGAQETTTSWGTGIEQMTLGFVKFTLQTYLNRIEQETNSKIFPKHDYFVEFNLDGLLRGDSKSEGEYMRQAMGGSMGPGWMTLNEIRRIKNLPPVSDKEGGNTFYEPKGNSNAQADNAIITR